MSAWMKPPAGEEVVVDDGGAAGLDQVKDGGLGRVAQVARQIDRNGPAVGRAARDLGQDAVHQGQVFFLLHDHRRLDHRLHVAARDCHLAALAQLITAGASARGCG